MKAITIAATAIALFGLMDEANAGFKTGNDLYRICVATDANSALTCYGYVDGVMDMMVFDSHMAKKSSCLPDGVQAQQAVDVVVKFLTEHPADRNFNAASLVYAAIEEAWNCQ
jgi:hypothetical protein